MLAASKLKLATDEIDGQSPVGGAAIGTPEEGHPVRRLRYPYTGRGGRQAAVEDEEIAGVSVGIAEAEDVAVVGLD